ncbi:MAG: glycosyltransferase family 39 protein [Flavobacterium sp.]|nr:glycosyltransferase family 39 protein [Flavobacterium sp.]
MIIKLKENYVLIAIIVFATILRLYHIDFQSIWLDEIHTMNEANPNLSFSEVYTSILSGEQMPPLYFYILHYLFIIFGYTTIIARVFSAILGVISLYAIFLLGKELVNKKIGLIASLLLCFNSFHLYFSQEARPYMMLLLFSILSFYGLIKYLKIPTRKNALIYGVFSALMIHSHFFGLFTLVSQILIIFFFLVISEKQNKKSFLINSLLAGLVIIVLFAPIFPIFLNITKIKEFWIPAPTPDSYTLIFKEFFGNSEILLTLLSLIIIFYLIKLSKEKDTPINYKSIINNDTILSFIILITWIIVVVLIPLIRSYISVPMIISRYFITLLPAIFLLIAISINQFNNRIFKYGIVCIFVIFSITDIVIVKRYYKVITKSQFREVTKYIIDNNIKKEPIVTGLGWYFSYFLNNNQIKNTVINIPLNDYIDKMRQDSTKIKPFWYTDAHNNPYNVKEENQKFIEEKFKILENINLFDSWTKHFVPIGTDTFKSTIMEIKDYQTTNGNKINYGVDNFIYSNKIISLYGWATLEEQDAIYSNIDLFLLSEDMKTILKLNNGSAIRNDVTKSYHDKYNLDNSGFNSKTSIDNLPKGKFQLGIKITNRTTKNEGFILTGRFIEN